MDLFATDKLVLNVSKRLTQVSSISCSTVN